MSDGLNLEKRFNPSLNGHSIENGVLNLNYSPRTAFLSIKNWVSVTVDKINEMGEILSHEEVLNLQMNRYQYQAYDRIYA